MNLLLLFLKINNNSYYEQGKQDSGFNIKKIVLTDDVNHWALPRPNGYEIVEGGPTYNLGKYDEVYVCGESFRITKYEFGGNVKNDAIGISYDASTGTITVDYGKSLYAGGGNHCVMTILYK